MIESSKLHVTHIASGDLWVGAEVLLYTLCKALNKLDTVSVNVILLNHGTLEQKLKEIEIPVTVLDESIYNSLQIGWRFFNQLKHQQPGIIHTHRLKENILWGWLQKCFIYPACELCTVHQNTDKAEADRISDYNTDLIVNIYY